MNRHRRENAALREKVARLEGEVAGLRHETLLAAVAAAWTRLAFDHEETSRALEVLVSDAAADLTRP